MNAPRRRRSAVPLLLGISVLPSLCGCGRQYVQSPLAQAHASVAETTEAHGRSARKTAAIELAGASEVRPTTSGDIAENLLRGEQEAAAGRPHQASRFYERVLRDDPQHFIAHHRLAVLADDAEDFDAAERHYLAALRSRPDDAGLLNDLGYSYVLQERFAEAEPAFRKAILLDRHHERAIANLAFLYVTVRSPERAVEVLNLADRDGDARDKLHELETIAASQGSARPLPHERAAVAATPCAIDCVAAKKTAFANADADVGSARHETPRSNPIERAESNDTHRVARAGSALEPYVRRAPSIDTAATAANAVPSSERQDLPLWTLPSDTSATTERDSARNSVFPSRLADTAPIRRTEHVAERSTGRLPPPFYSEITSSERRSEADGPDANDRYRHAGVRSELGHSDSSY